ncbi:uncharacterized protein EDB93DRAFT_1102816 [Suillus bovinus]|uniref:uncharacterized protein n=1 Tax=Suillus bovinus TaxID=48563 RepID=UPI001B86827C|nr:uncharacterized protein EDB93DRAFT_1102816 [Suillus bovinus]KAG2153069.1 hypothetical protein EDB93DRAFT_1102816 [Suillus bovinus]
MPSQHQDQARTSPKKRKTKCKAADSDGQDVTSTKKSRAEAEASIASQQPTRCSGRPGVGTGGRISQLKIIGALLGAPAHTSQPKGSTSLDSSIPTNPLAPEPPRKGHRGQMKKPPPPYSASGEPMVSAPSRPQGKKATAAKNTTLVALTVKSMDSAPSRPRGKKATVTKDTTPIASTVKPPNLQPSFIHPREKEALSASLDLTGHLPTAATTAANQYLAPPVPSRSTLAARQPDANSDLFQNLEPTLRPVNNERLGQHGPQDSGAESTETSSEGGNGNTDDNNDDEDHTDNEVGWGAAQGQVTEHPGFSKEDLPSQPRVARTLPIDFNFQYSRDEGDINAERCLADDISSTDDTAIKPDDVLQRHHQKNGRPQLPDPQVLDLLRHTETKSSKSKDMNVKTASAKVKESGDGPRATQLGWYGPRWKNFLEVTKSKCRAQHAIENPFPKLAKDLTGSINKILMASLIEWLEGGQQVEEGVWPDHKHDMAKLLYEDLSTWHSDLKKIVASIVPSMYDLIPPSHVPPQQHAAWVEEAATKLLKDSIFLHNGVDDQGKTENASHPVLREAAISFFYTGSYRVARRRPEVFQKSLPLECLALVNCVLDGFSKNSSGKSFPKFSAKEYSSLYTAMLVKLETIMDDPYHRPKLARQLRSWAAAGWQVVFVFKALHADEVLTGRSPTKLTAM